MIKKVLSFFLILVLLFFHVPSTTYGLETDYSDYNGHWAESTIKSWIESSYISGYPDGTIKPEGFITRAEFVKLVNTAFSINQASDITFTDVNINDWYYSEVQKAYGAGYITGTSNDKFSPNTNITREQAAIIISKVLNLNLSSNGAEVFSDFNNISEWARNYVGSAANEEIVKGYNSDNTFRPQNPIKRAEALVMLNRALQKVQPPDLVIDTPGTVIENTTINNLHITKDVGDGDITLKNVIIIGELLVEGGGQNSIIIENSTVNKLTANKPHGKIRILVEGGTTVESTTLKSSVILEQKQLSEKSFEKISIDVNSSVQLKINKTLNFVSSDKSVATIDRNGIVTAKKSGSTVISATIGGKSKEICEITVVDPLDKTIKILTIGNSFSQDTVFYLYDIAKSAGVNIIVGNVYNSGCSFERHWNYALNNEKAYTYYKWDSSYMTTTKGMVLRDIIHDESWDYITLQQSSGESGLYSTYQPYLNNLITYIKGMAVNPNVKLAFNATWAYSSTSNNENFVNYNYNQINMYNAINSSFKKAIEETGISIIIPSGTAIQNARANRYLNSIGNELTIDGYHLETGLGRYIAGLSLFNTIIKEENLNVDLQDVKYIPNSRNYPESYISLAKKAVKNAILNPFEITK